MTAVDLVMLACCDLGGIVRGRSLASSELAAHVDVGVGWVPANHALTPLGGLANPWQGQPGGNPYPYGTTLFQPAAASR